MLKPLLQELLGLTGHAFVSKRRFGWDVWKDIKTLLEPTANPIVFDVGAHTGETLKMVQREFPTASIFCFEPDPESFRELEKVVAEFSAPQLFQAALGDVSGSFPFFRNAESMTNSLLPTAPQAKNSEVGALMLSREKISVPVITIDEFCGEHSLERIDLLKIDCQGFDLRVLKGANDMLLGGQVGVIQCEAIFDPQYTGQGWFYEVLEFLTGHEYALCGIHHAARNSYHEITFADVLFKRRSGC
ncbi:MAG: FkbM family methyltransferase [Bryobacteraceae bacterium]